MTSEGNHIIYCGSEWNQLSNLEGSMSNGLDLRRALGIETETEECPDRATEADKHAKFMAWKDRAQATIVLAVEPSLLYLLGDPEDPVAVWKRLSGQFQKKTWANKLNLRKKLFTIKLSDSGSMKEYSGTPKCEHFWDQ